MGMEPSDFELDLAHTFLLSQMILTKDESKHFTALVSALQAAHDSMNALESLIDKDKSEDEHGETPLGRMPRDMVAEAIGFLGYGIDDLLIRLGEIERDHHLTLTD